MGVYIRDMEMPTRCCDCKMYVEDIYCCHLLNREIENPWADDGVELDCPLVPVPPHGRLIDADALIEKYNSIPHRYDRGMVGMVSNCDLFDALVYDLQKEPTIIEAEEGE